MIMTNEHNYKKIGKQTPATRIFRYQPLLQLSTIFATSSVEHAHVYMVVFDYNMPRAMFLKIKYMDFILKWLRQTNTHRFDYSMKIIHHRTRMANV